MRDLRYVTQRAGWIVLAARDGALLAEEIGDPDGHLWPVAPIVAVHRAGFDIECPTCPPMPRAGRPRRHSHGILGETRGSLGEGHRLGHGPGCGNSPGYIVLLLDADGVELSTTH